MEDTKQLGSPGSSVQENDSNTTTVRGCLVCGGIADGTHFGVDACRACAAFFRRTVVCSKQYICRLSLSGGACRIHHSARMCRKCRLTKCYSVGMIVEHVQNRPTKQESSADSCSSLTFETIQRESVVVATPSTAPNDDLLSKIQENYRQLVTVQRSTEYTVLHTSHKGLFDAMFQETQPVHADFHLMSKMARAFVPSMTSFIQTTFPVFNELSHDEKWTLFRNFGTVVWIYQSAYFTHKAWEDFRDKYMFTQTTIVEKSNMRHFYDKVSTEKTKDALEKLLSECLEKSTQLTVLIRDLDPTDIEQAVLVGLMLWDPNVGVLNEKIQRISLHERNILFEELDKYYRNELGMQNYAGRLGKLMCIFSSVQWNASLFKEELELYNLMDVFDHDPFIYDFLKR